MHDSFATYPQPMRSTSSSSNTGRPPTGSWSSVHPSASAPVPVRSDSGARNAVKLEDLVSQERSTRPGTGRSTVGGGGGAGLTSLPLSATQSSDHLKGGKEEGGGGGNNGPSEFIKKLYRMLEDESALYGKGRPSGAPREQGAKKGPVGWSRGGISFVVWDMNNFTTKVL
jgi:osomolarity two-component system response regulator SKN7